MQHHLKSSFEQRSGGTRKPIGKRKLSGQKEAPHRPQQHQPTTSSPLSKNDSLSFNDYAIPQLYSGKAPMGLQSTPVPPDMDFTSTPLIIPDPSETTSTVDYMPIVESLENQPLKNISLNTGLNTPSSSSTSSARYICALCPSKPIFSTKATFRRHVNDRHAPRCVYHCPVSTCGWESRRRDKMHDHLRIVHGKFERLKGEELNKKQQPLPCPSACDLCHKSVGSWDEFFTCVSSHCLESQPQNDANDSSTSSNDLPSSILPRLQIQNHQIKIGSIPALDYDLPNDSRHMMSYFASPSPNSIQRPSIVYQSPKGSGRQSHQPAAPVQHDCRCPLCGICFDRKADLDHHYLQSHTRRMSFACSGSGINDKNFHATEKDIQRGCSWQFGARVKTERTSFLPTSPASCLRPQIHTAENDQDSEIGVQTPRSVDAAPPRLSHGSIGSRSDSGTVEMTDSDLYDDVGSIFASGGLTICPLLNHSQEALRQLKVHYANCLYWLVHQQLFAPCPVNTVASGNDTSPDSQSNSGFGSMAPPASTGKRKVDALSSDGTPCKGNRNGRDDDDGDDFNSSRPNKMPRSGLPPQRRVACPFFKRYPDIFTRCGLGDHENSARVKQHLKREHQMPIYCPRCSMVFKSEKDRDSHIRVGDCPIHPEVERLCVTSDQDVQLRRPSRGKTDRENWYAIYRVLFPNDPLPESPYLDQTLSAEVNTIREAFLSAAPTALRAAIQRVVPEAAGEAYADELEQVVYTTHVEVFDRILSTMRSRRSSSERCLVRQPASSSRSDSLRTPDSGFGSSLNAGDVQRDNDALGESQSSRSSNLDDEVPNVHNTGTVPGMADFSHISTGLDGNFEHLALMNPLTWSFDRLEDSFFDAGGMENNSRCS